MAAQVSLSCGLTLIPPRFPHWRDLRRSRLSDSASPHTSPPTWLTLLKPGGLPIEPMPGSALVNGVLWRGHLRAIGDFVEGGRTLLAIGKPSMFALELLKRLRDCPSLYDAMDDFSTFYTGFSRFAMMRRESAKLHSGRASSWHRVLRSNPGG